MKKIFLFLILISSISFAQLDKSVVKDSSNYVIPLTTGYGYSGFNYNSNDTLNTFMNNDTLIFSYFPKGNNLFLIGYRNRNYSASIFGNIAIGRNTMVGNNPTSDNIAIGTNSMINVNNACNTALGVYSSGLLTTGTKNTSIGWHSLVNNSGGSYNTCLGAASGALINNGGGGSNNVSIGYLALGTGSNYAGNDNISIGYNSGQFYQGNQNILIGTQAGGNGVGGNSNTICIGYFSPYAALPSSNYIYIGRYNNKDVLQIDMVQGIGQINNDTIMTYHNSFVTNVISQTGNYSALSTDRTILMSAATLTDTVFLPTVYNGKDYVIKKIDATANVVFVKPSGSQTIDGATGYALLTQNKYVSIRGYGSSWYIVGNN